MKAYIQCDRQKMPYNINAYCAMRGFQQMGFETVLFYGIDEMESSERKDIIVGGVGTIKERLKKLCIDSKDIDYPAELNPYYGRRIWRSTTREFLSMKWDMPIFIKPVEGKLFEGTVIKTIADLIGRINSSQDLPIFCSEVLHLKEEWRCFIRYGKILDIRRYKGGLGRAYELERVEKAIKDFTFSPAAYAMDIAVTEKGKTVIVEINDGYSLGSYGLDPLLYAKLLSARWAEITGTEDECKFD